jgi:hypothetical protein
MSITKKIVFDGRGRIPGSCHLTDSPRTVFVSFNEDEKKMSPFLIGYVNVTGVEWKMFVFAVSKQIS